MNYCLWGLPLLPVVVVVVEVSQVLLMQIPEQPQQRPPQQFSALPLFVRVRVRPLIAGNVNVTE